MARCTSAEAASSCKTTATSRNARCARAALFAALDKVKTWEPPAKKGRFSFDDKKFFLSLKQQYAAGKSLSYKQLAALKKLAAKYMEH